MFYKTLNNSICCYCNSDKGTGAVYSPFSVSVVNNKSIPWQYTDKNIVRLSDFSFVFEDDPRVFEDLKQVKLKALAESFNVCVSGSFTTVEHYNMQFNVEDALKMKGAIELMEATGASTGYITQANDETIYDVPIETMRSVLIQMLNAFAQCHAKKQQLRQQIATAATKEELDAIEFIWPV